MDIFNLKICLRLVDFLILFTILVSVVVISKVAHLESITVLVISTLFYLKLISQHSILRDRIKFLKLLDKFNRKD